MNKKIKQLLYRSFDQELTPEERSMLNKTLSNSEALRIEKNKIENMRAQIANISDFHFQPSFVDKVMNRVREEKVNTTNGIEDFFESFLWSFKRYAIGSILIVCLLFLINVLNAGSVTLESALAIPQINIEKTLVITDLFEEE
jgi:hypothetical protein